MLNIIINHSKFRIIQCFPFQINQQRKIDRWHKVSFKFHKTILKSTMHVPMNTTWRSYRIKRTSKIWSLNKVYMVTSILTIPLAHISKANNSSRHRKLQNKRLTAYYVTKREKICKFSKGSRCRRRSSRRIWEHMYQMFHQLTSLRNQNTTSKRAQAINITWLNFRIMVTQEHLLMFSDTISKILSKSIRAISQLPA